MCHSQEQTGLASYLSNMSYTYLRKLIREIIKEKSKLLTEPEEVLEDEETQNEFSAGGVAGAHAVGHRPKKNKKK